MLTERELEPVSEGDERYSPPPTHPILLTVALVLLVFATVGSLQWWISEAGIADVADPAERIEVPRLAGTSVEAARAELGDAGLEVAVAELPNVRVERGLVFAQEPAGGEQVEPGVTVTITVSTGSDRVVVPEITGSLDHQVEAQLATYGLVLGQVSTRQDQSSLAGEVLEQDPAPGQVVTRGAALDVVVSEGPPPVRVPDVFGLPEGEAAAILGEAGFVVERVRIYSPVRVGSAVSTSPRADTEVAYGSDVRLFVSRGSTPTRPTAPSATTVPPSTPSPTTPPVSPPPVPGPAADPPP